MTIIPRGNRDIVWAPKMPSRHATCEYSWEQAAEPIASRGCCRGKARRGSCRRAVSGRGPGAAGFKPTGAEAHLTYSGLGAWRTAGPPDCRHRHG